MLTKRLIDASPFDKFIISIPEDVGDEYSYIHGVEDVLSAIREAKTEDDSSLQTGEKYGEAKFLFRGEKEVFPRATIWRNGDITFHCDSVQKAKELAQDITFLCWTKNDKQEVGAEL